MLGAYERREQDRKARLSAKGVEFRAEPTEWGRGKGRLAWAVNGKGTWSYFTTTSNAETIAEKQYRAGTYRGRPLTLDMQFELGGGSGCSGKDFLNSDEGRIHWSPPAATQPALPPTVVQPPIDLTETLALAQPPNEARSEYREEGKEDLAQKLTETDLRVANLDSLANDQPANDLGASARPEKRARVDVATQATEAPLAPTRDVATQAGEVPLTQLVTQVVTEIDELLDMLAA